MDSQERPRLTVPGFAARKRKGETLTMLTAYDAVTTRTAEAAAVDALLVGDSLGNVILGYDTTLKVTLEDIKTYRALIDEGVMVAPVFLPPHFADMKGLAAWMSFSRFIST